MHCDIIGAVRIHLKKLDGGVVLCLLRDGAPPAVQRSEYGGFFAVHDLLHYAVETTLGLRCAFLGLMADGWCFATFGDRTDERYRNMPPEAMLAEHLVDVLLRRLGESARRDPELWPLWRDEVNTEIARILADTPHAGFRLSDEALRTIAERYDELLRRWAHVAVGEHLELVFPSDEFAPRGA